MPTYDYECSKCKNVVELFHGMSETPSTKCPKCGEDALVKLISGGAGVLFKGGGFYQTDYPSAEYQKDASNDKPSPGASCPSGGACEGCPNAGA